MYSKKNLYTNVSWHDFSMRVQERDNRKCMRCLRPHPAVVLQVHHEIYLPNKLPWEYALSDCTTLCKGCHAREHGLIEPNCGWFLMAIDDLQDLSGVCEREGCGNDIRYEHLTYHPNWGYKKVGSTCIEHLTKEDKSLSDKVLSCYRNVSKFVNGSAWNRSKTLNNKGYVGAKHGHDVIRIYGEEGRYAFQVALKEKGRKYYHYQDIVRIPGKSLVEAKELSYITLKGLISKDAAEISMLRNLYKSIR